ncbi:CHASE3 domain-containing protein [Pseudohongiella spirulinae]|nr:CHASE3 domain-containing protein [Pseudohongiella spirulinae]
MKSRRVSLSHHSLTSKLIAGFALILLVILVLISVTRLSLSNIDANVDANVSSYQTLDKISTLLSSVLTIESGMRGFALTGNNMYLERLDEGSLKIKEVNASLSESDALNAEQVSQLSEFFNIYTDWFANDIEPIIG